MEDILIIEDLKKLRITKVKTYKVTFKYEDREFIILDNSSYGECGLVLMERVWVKDNRCVLNIIKCALTCRNPFDFIKDISKTKPNNVTYSNIDREYFVKMLAEMNFIGGKYADSYKELKEKQDKLNEKIRELQREVSNLYKEWRKPSGHGSKQYGIEIKTKVAERIKGAEKGEWCEQYNAEYGSEHPIYGGTLIDLFTLPVGTTFYVTNGQYDAFISVDEHGDKCVVTLNSCVKLTKDNHSAYVE